MSTRMMFARVIAEAAMAVMASTALAEWNDAGVENGKISVETGKEQTE